MDIRKIGLIKVQVAITVGFMSGFMIFLLPVRAQESDPPEEEQSILVESTVVGDVDPADALTVSDLDIPVDQLELLVKPLTLEDLQVEAAAWLLLLKNKVQEISNAEIAVKRQNLVIEAEENAAAALDNAQTKISEAEAKLAETEEGSKEHEAAYKQLEDAKDALQTAQLAVEEAAKTSESLQEDTSLQSALEDAQLEQQVTFAQEVLKAAQQERESLTEGSEAYIALTEKIDALDQALVDLEVAEEDLDGIVPGTPEYQELSDGVTAIRSQINAATQALSESGIGPSNDLEDSQSIDESQADLEEEAQQLAAVQETIGETTDQEQTPSVPSTEQLTDLQEDLEGKADAQADVKNQLVAEATELQTDRAAIMERFDVVLDAIEKKGGDTTSYRKYVDAVSGIELDVTDTEGLGVRLVAWLTAEEGGLRWLINVAKFVGILIAAVIVSQLVGRFTNRALRQFGNTSTLFREFAVIFLKRTVLVIGSMLALASLGVSLGPVLAVLGGASFVLAFALQSNLGNFASGLMLLVTKPFDVGDEVKVAGYWAYVDSISLANTKLKDFGGSIVTLPNNTVWGADIINYTHTDIRKLQISVYVKFDQDLDQLRSIWMDIVNSQPKLLKDPAPGWFPWNGHYEYYVSVGLSAWTKTEDYWGMYVELLKLIQQRFQEHGIELAAPNQTINLSSNGEALLPTVEATPKQP